MPDFDHHLGAGPTPDAALALIEEISHRVMNDYARAISHLRLAAKTVDDVSAARLAMLAAAQRLQSHADAHRALQAPSSTGLLDVDDYLQAVCFALSKASLADAGIRLTIVRCSAVIDAGRCWRLGLVVTELVNNAARHGLGWAAGEIRVDLALTQSELHCSVSDNGQSAAPLTMGRGSRIITALVADFGGRVDWVFNAEGTHVIVRMPLLAPATH